MPYLDPFHKDQEGEDKGHTGHEKLETHHQLTAIQAITKNTSPWTHEKGRKSIYGSYSDYQ